MACTFIALSISVYEISPEQDRDLANLKLGASGVEIDELTAEQIEYLSDYSAGT